MPTLAQIRVFPVKSLDGIDLEQATISENGNLWRDRAYAMFDAEGKIWWAKRSEKMHLLRTTFDAEARRITLRVQDRDDAPVTFDLETEHDAMSDWLSAFFGRRIELRHCPGGMPDDQVVTGPTVISTATLREVASWYPHLTAEDIRRRVRVNLVIDAEPAFWEDHLLADFDHGERFRIGDAQLEAVSPCGRCVVPTRDPETGEKDRDFQKVCVKQREATFPESADRTRFDHFFYLTVRTNVPESQWGRTLHVGDEVQLLGKAAIQS